MFDSGQFVGDYKVLWIVLVLCLKTDLQIALIPIWLKTEERSMAESTSKSVYIKTGERELQEIGGICLNQLHEAPSCESLICLH